MSVLLYRLGRFSYKRPWVFITTWLLILGTIIALASTSDFKISSAITIDDTESQSVIDELHTEFPQQAGGQGTIVFTAPEGERLDEGARADAIRSAMDEIASNDFVVERSTEDLAELIPETQLPERTGMPEGTQMPEGAQMPGGTQLPDGVQPPGGQPVPEDASGMTGNIQSPPNAVDQEAMLQQTLLDQGMLAPGVLVSNDGNVAMMQIQFTEQVEELPDGVIDAVVETAVKHADEAGLTALPTETLEPQEAPLGGHEALGLLVAALVLIVTLGSLRAAGLPLITAVIGVAIGLGGAFALSETIELTSATPVLALMIGLAVGIDYALFIVNRQRHLMLNEALSAHEATGRSLGTAGNAVVFAGLIVIIALSGLTLIGIAFLTTMALVAAATVLLAVFIALTLLPALLGIVGERIVSPNARIRHEKRSEDDHVGFASRFVTGVVKRRGIVIVSVVALLAIAAIPMAQMTLGMPHGARADLDTSERQAAEAITASFGEGYNAPLVSVVRAPEHQPFEEADLPGTADAIAEHTSVDTVRPMAISPDDTLALFSVIPTEGPDAESTQLLVHELRSDTGELTGTAGTQIGVTGLTATNLDITDKLEDALPLYITIIVVLSLLVLLVVFRSVLIPIKATVGFLLTIGATFGIMTAIFQWGWLKEIVGFDTAGPILSFLPIMVTGILYGLAMDYEVFLVSSMGEAHARGHRSSDAVVQGFSQASRVVVAAATIMVAVFAGFIFSDDSMVKQFGLALAVGILIDAFLIRMVLVPAVMAFLGRGAWWLPKWLDKLLPDLDIEGHRLAEQLDDEQPQPEQKTLVSSNIS